MKTNDKRINRIGVEDEAFIRGAIPMTKSEVRAVTVSKLRLYKGCRVLDIGSGTGSVSIECALNGGLVHAVERNSEGVCLLEKNMEHFKAKNIEVIQGIAPLDLPRETIYDRVFIGGSGGQLVAIFDYLETHLVEGGMLVANTVTIENTARIVTLMKDYGYSAVEITQVSISKSKSVGELHMMLAHNPVSIISGKKR